ncbi:hypothetical protein ACX27_05415 [Nostoc piscinale CENA21]|uniref:Uncharacterized protein n=1 Tax=Nostoc piscinale CENA21 TaxID=224013 RepID=A0A0M4TUH3_9NOSO|nr:hypothetical protein [Nostoc piscinale]ALF52414.1 hypothetical protein ACX27_05415 [Nostoc piscinale CENA21]
MSSAFDPSLASARIDKFWELSARFGQEDSAKNIYLNEIVSDRYTLVNGLQILRDELQFAGASISDLKACAADLSLPSVVTTLAYTNCGDRIHQGESTRTYRDVVASRFATLSEIGELKTETFFPTGGGTDDGATLAHVTIAHQLDETWRSQIYAGNSQSFILAALDLKTHVGRLDLGEQLIYGKTQESLWREPRAACGAIVGALTHFNSRNIVHQRLRRDIGEENYEFLSSQQILADDGTDITMAVAAAIVAIRGLEKTAIALGKEMDERGMAHLTATTTVNVPFRDDPVIYLARATVFNGLIRIQGLGADASKYSGKIIHHLGEKHLQLIYDDLDNDNLAIEEIPYRTRKPVVQTYDPQLDITVIDLGSGELGVENGV